MMKGILGLTEMIVGDIMIPWGAVSLLGLLSLGIRSAGAWSFFGFFNI